MLRIGIIGCGNIFTMHATSTVNIKGAKLVGVCDIKKERAQKAAKDFNTKFYTDYKQLITKDKIDAVHICVPHYLHAVIANYALNQGVNVLCEKPMSIDFKSAQENVRLAKEKNLKYGIIFQCRFNDASQLVKNALDEGKLGKINSARVVLTWNRAKDYYHSSDWKGTWDKEGGGVIIDQAIHSLDLANWFIGDKVKEIQASLHRRGHKDIEVEDTGEGLIYYENGATLSFFAMNNYSCDEPIEIRLFCEKGKAVLSYEKAQITLNDGTVLSAEQQNDNIDYKGGKDYWGFQHIKQIKDFYQSIVLDTKPYISGEDALKIQEIVCGIYEKGKITL